MPVALSVTWIVNMPDHPAVVGVPVITPLEERVRPAGRAPLATVHVYGGFPPLAASVAEYAVPTVPFIKSEVRIVKFEGTAIDMLTTPVATVPVASVTCSVKLYAPVAVGVPESAPALVCAIPGGNDPDATVQVYGAVPPTAFNVAL